MPNYHVTINSAWFSNKNICVKMSDGKVIEIPIQLYPNLRKGTAVNKSIIMRSCGGGKWMHWEELDEDLSVEGFLQMNDLLLSGGTRYSRQRGCLS